MFNGSGSFHALSIGLASADPSWRSLLDSEGLPWQIVADKSSGPLPEVIIVPWGADAATRRFCGRLAAQGSAIVTEQRRPEGVAAAGPQRRSFPYHRDDFSGLRSSDLPGAVHIEYGRCGAGEYYLLPFRLGEVWPSNRTGKRYVVVDPEREVRLWHRQAWVVKKNVRRVVVEVVRGAFFGRGLPVVHKWYWPGESRSVFCMRADLDGGSPQNLVRFLDAVRPFARSASLFVCARRYLDKGDLVRQAARDGLEVGNHTYSHMVFPDAVTNRVALARADRFLAALGIAPQGLAAPAYFWHPSMYPPLAARGYRYASCFGLDHDNVPYYPVVKGHTQSVLEVPFHCLGDLFPKFDIPLDGEASRRFFAGLIAKKHAAGEAINLYGHADMDGRLGSAPGLTRFLCEQALGLPNVWTGHLADLDAWWRRRQESELDPWFDTDRERLVCHTRPGGSAGRGDLMLSVHLPDGSWRLIGPDACSEPGVDVRGVRALAPLRQPEPADVGEVVHVEESSTLAGRLRNRRVALKRLARAYADVYCRRAAPGDSA